MTVPVLLAHAPGEEDAAEQLAAPLRNGGYDVVHAGTVLIGDSVVEQYSKHIAAGSPVVLCGTVKALGTGWAYRVVNSVRAANSGSRVFAVQIEKDAYVDALALDGKVAPFWQDPGRATSELLSALNHYYGAAGRKPGIGDAEERYRRLALESCDIIDLANLPENDRHIATRQLELRRLYVALRVHKHLDRDMEEVERARLEKRLPAEGEGIAIGELLGESPRIVVLGDPGSGKTTLLRWLATAFLLRLNANPDWQSLPDVGTLPDRDWLPIIVRCRDLDAGSVSGTLEDVLGHTLRKAELPKEQAQTLRTAIMARLERGDGILLIDGLDEIGDAVTRARFAQQIERVAIAYPKAPIIATSRIVGYREMGYRIGRGFVHTTVADLTEEDKDEFARRWCALTELPERREAATGELIHDIHSTDRIERLTGNPMLLTTMALVKRKVGRLPNRRVDLYFNALQVLLNWRREVDEPIDDREAVPQLQYLAYAMCERGAQQLRRDEVIAILDAFKEEHPQVRLARRRSSEDFLQLLEQRTGILIEAGHTRYNGQLTPVYEFRHLTFQEYLAGLALVSGHHPGYDRTVPIAERVARIAVRTADSDSQGAEQWREALRLCVAACNDADVDAVLRAIVTPAPDESGATRAARITVALLCLADEPNASESTAEEVFRAGVEAVDESRPSQIANGLMEVADSSWLEVLRPHLRRAYMRSSLPTETELPMAYICDSIWSPPGQATPEWEARVLQALGDADEIAAEAAFGIIGLETKRRIDPFVPALTRMIEQRRVHTAFPAAWALGLAAEKEGWRPTRDFDLLVADVLEQENWPAELAGYLLTAVQFSETPELIDGVMQYVTADRPWVRMTAAKTLKAAGSLEPYRSEVVRRLRMLQQQEPDHLVSERIKQTLAALEGDHEDDDPDDVAD